MPSPRAADRIWLADWRRRVSELYGHVRTEARADPERAWNAWRAERESLFRTHPQSPVPVAEREAFRARHWPYDPTLRFELGVQAAPEAAASPGSTGRLAATAPLAPIALPNSGDQELAFDRIGALVLPLPDGPALLSVYWMRGYTGGIFVPFRDATSGNETYAAGRYLLDTAKGADLGGDPDAGTLIVDLNFAYHPSCAFDPRWACPLARPDDRIDVAVRAGERLR